MVGLSGGNDKEEQAHVFGERRGKSHLFSLILFPALTVLGSLVKSYVEIPAKHGQNFNHGFSVSGGNLAHWLLGVGSGCCRRLVLAPRNLTTTLLPGFSPGSAGHCCLDVLHALGREDGAHDSRASELSWS